MGAQTHTLINLSGGLNLVDPHYVRQQIPGQASRLVNFESSIEAGYRRINGFSKYGNTQPTGSADTILGVHQYADGMLVTAATGVYFSTDGSTWLQVNRDTWVAQTDTVTVQADLVTVTTDNTLGEFTTEYAVGDHIRINGEVRQIATITDDDNLTVESAFTAQHGPVAHYKNGTTSLTGSVIARTGQGKAQFAHYPEDGEYGSIAFTDKTGGNPVGWFKITGSGVGRTYYYEHLGSDYAAPADAKHCVTFKERLVLANSEADPGTIFYSERFSNQRFDGTGSDTIALEAPIKAIRPLRDKLIIFTENAIYQLVNIESATDIAILPITKNTGIAASCSVQEMGGDLIFLSHDGIRVLSVSDVYGDVQFGVISRKIDPIIKELVDNLDSYTISSLVLRDKNQYRLFYTQSGVEDSQQLGIVGTLRRDSSGNIAWQWSQLQGIPVAAACAQALVGEGTGDELAYYHGGYNGYVYYHNSGNDFDGNPISATMVLHEFDYGNPAQRKTLHWVKLTGTFEGATDQIQMTVKYDNASELTAQPAPYRLDGSSGIAVYGTAVYYNTGTGVGATYGGATGYDTRVLVEGSGYSSSFEFDTSGTGAPYSIDGLFIDYRLGGLW